MSKKIIPSIEEEENNEIPAEKPRRIQTAEGWKRSMLKKLNSEKASEASAKKSKSKKSAL